MHKTPQIRRATIDDAAVIATILYESFCEFRPLYTDGGFAATTSNPEGILSRIKEGPVWVATRGNVAIGTVAAVLQGKSLYIRGMAVLPVGERSRSGQVPDGRDRTLCRPQPLPTPFPQYHSLSDFCDPTV